MTSFKFKAMNPSIPHTENPARTWGVLVYEVSMSRRGAIEITRFIPQRKGTTFPRPVDADAYVWATAVEGDTNRGEAPWVDVRVVEGTNTRPEGRVYYGEIFTAEEVEAEDFDHPAKQALRYKLSEPKMGFGDAESIMVLVPSGHVYFVRDGDSVEPLDRPAERTADTPLKIIHRDLKTGEEAVSYTPHKAPNGR